MSRLRIAAGRVIDPASGFDGPADVLVQDGRVVGLATADEGGTDWDVFDAHGLVVAPGFVDLHCHLREPGFEHKETIASGTAAAVAGGYTTICAMPNTSPTTDTASDVGYVLQVAYRDGRVRVCPIGTITKGQRGQELSEMADMTAAGAVAFSDDGHPVVSSRVMRHALEYSRLVERPIVDHCEDDELMRGAVMHEGRVSALLGLPGVPAAAEEIAVGRDLALARLTGGWLHLAHVSTRAAVRLLERAKQEGLRVSAEVTPHHLTLTDEWLAGRFATPPYDSRCRVNPPLRPEDDADALVEALRQGVLDCIATDHAPHARVDKECEIGVAAPGISGLETSFGLLMRLVHQGRLSLATLISRLTVDPARAFRLEAGTLRPAVPADVVLVDPGAEWTVDSARFRSKGKNTPLDGVTLRGRVVATFVAGELVHRAEVLAHD